MRIDRPRDRAASGSFRDPNSTRTTTAMMSIFHGLSNKSPSMSPLNLRMTLGRFYDGGTANSSLGERIAPGMHALRVASYPPFGALPGTDGRPTDWASGTRRRPPHDHLLEASLTGYCA